MDGWSSKLQRIKFFLLSQKITGCWEYLREPCLKGTLFCSTSKHGGEELWSLGLCCVCRPLRDFLGNWRILCNKGKKKENISGILSRRKANELWPCSVVSDSQLHVSCHRLGDSCRSLPLWCILPHLPHFICICGLFHIWALSSCVLQIWHHKHLWGKRPFPPCLQERDGTCFPHKMSLFSLGFLFFYDILTSVVDDYFQGNSTLFQQSLCGMELKV